MIPVSICDEWPIWLPEHRQSMPWATWECERLRSMRAHIHQGDVVIDVGAEEGDLPALYAHWGARIILIEPNPKVWPNMRAIWQANELPDPLLHFVGFAGAEHRAPSDNDWLNVNHLGLWTEWPPSSYGNIIDDHGFMRIEERVEVPVIPLDAIRSFLDERIDAVTIDVEGAEMEVLRGARDMLTEDRPLVWCSVHADYAMEPYGDTPEDVPQFMLAHGYGMELLADDHEQHWLFTPKERIR